MTRQLSERKDSDDKRRSGDVIEHRAAIVDVAASNVLEAFQMQFGVEGAATVVRPAIGQVATILDMPKDYQAAS